MKSSDELSDQRWAFFPELKAMFIRLLTQTSLLFVLAVGAGVLAYCYHPLRPPLYQVLEVAVAGEITATAARVASGRVIWLDARSESAYQAEHIPGALLLNEANWENLLMAIFPVLAEAAEGIPVVIYCDGQQCDASRAVRDRLRQTPLGDRELLILHGGWPAWKAAGP